jgi:cyclase
MRARHCLAAVLMWLGGLAFVQAQEPPAPPSFVAIAPGVSAFSGPATTLLLLETGAGALLVDSEMPKSADAVRAALDAAGVDALRYVVNTHWHLDHAGGNEALAARGALVLAHENARRRMSEPTYLKHLDKVMPPLPAAALPAITLKDSGALHIGGVDIQLIHVPAAHTDGDLLVRLPAANVLHMGDCFFNGLYPIIDTGTGGTVDGLIAALDRGLALSDAHTRIVAGHGPMGTRTDLQAARDMLAQLRERVAALKREGRSRAETLAAKPSDGFDARWGQGWVKPAQIVGSIYDSLP